jgi:hypothetical protein
MAFLEGKRSPINITRNSILSNKVLAQVAFPSFDLHQESLFFDQVSENPLVGTGRFCFVSEASLVALLCERDSKEE